MKHLFTFLFAAALSTTLFAQTSTTGGGTERHSRVRIYANEQGFAELTTLGICTDHGTMKPGYWFETDLSDSELGLVRAKGFTCEVLVENVSEHYVEQNNPSSLKYSPPPTPQSIGCNPPPSYNTPANFSLGSMGGFFTEAEILAHLDNMSNLFPNLITVKAPLPNQTEEGRNVYWVKISDNPNVNEPEPEVLYNADHHAREPAAVSQLIFYMYYLLENYGSNAEVQYLVNNSEMYFIPLVNPDGYCYNQSTNPNGGGMWRKNRKNNGDGTYGVDLNRNYPYNWGYDNQGSSPNTSSSTYRGPSAGSEPETQNLISFCNSHAFKIGINYHTYGDLLIYPWGYENNIYTPDSAQFTAYGAHLTTYNHWSYGTANQTVLYTANGTSDDWMYGEQSSKPKIMAFTPEAGQSDEGFWPPSNRIIPICGEAVWQNLRVCHLALKYAKATDNEQNYLPNLSGFFNYKLQRLGMDAPATYTVSIIPLSSYITSVGGPRTYSSLALMQEVSDSISFTLSGTTPNGQLLQYIIAVDNGSYTVRDTITKRYGTPVIVFQSNGNSMTGWTSTTWGVTTQKFHSATSSITDSPGGDYNSGANTNIRTSAQLNLTDAISAQLTFWGTWDLETNFDYVEVQASNDNGNTWNNLCGKLTKLGNGFQNPDEPLYDAFMKQWLYEEMPLDAYIGQNILIRFRLRSDNGGEYDGFYFDDLKVEKIVNVPQGVNENAPGGFVLSQNIPNPAGNSTTIAYSLPAHFSSASLVIYNSIGQIIQTEKLNKSAGTITVDIAALPVGMYYYRLETGNEHSGMMKMMIGK